MSCRPFWTDRAVGKEDFHCPYCHGYELNGGMIGVLASSPLAIHQALMLPDWGPTTLFLNEAYTPDVPQLAQLARRGVTVEAEPVLSIGEGQADITLASGRIIRLAGLFIQPGDTPEFTFSRSARM